MPSPRLTAPAAVAPTLPILLILLTLLAGCAAAVPSSGPVTLTEHQRATVAPGAVVTYDSVSDSRCPPDVRCVVAGKVAYSFTLQVGGTLEHFTLAPGAPDFVSLALGGKRIMLSAPPPPPQAHDAAAAHPVSIRVVAP